MGVARQQIRAVRAGCSIDDGVSGSELVQRGCGGQC